MVILAPIWVVMPPKNARKRAQTARRRSEKILRQREALQETILPSEVDYSEPSTCFQDSEDDETYCSDDFTSTDDDEDDDNCFNNLTIPIDNISVYWLSIQNTQKMFNALDKAKEKADKDGAFISKENFEFEYNEGRTRIKPSLDETTRKINFLTRSGPFKKSAYIGNSVRNIQRKRKAKEDSINAPRDVKKLKQLSMFSFVTRTVASTTAVPTITPSRPPP